MMSQNNALLSQPGVDESGLPVRHRLLIVGQHPELWEFYQHLLQAIPGLQVETRYHSAETKMIPTGPYELIMVDGVGLVPIIRGIQQLQPRTPIIFISGIAQNLITFLKQHELAVFGTLKKPFPIEDFFENVCHALKLPVVKGWEQTAEGGCREAAVIHGLNLFRGKWSPPDPAAAVKWFQTAALAGSGDGQNLLSACLLQGLGTRADQEEGLRWLHQAAAQKNHAAEFNLGCWHAFGPDPYRSNKEAMSWFELAAKGGVHLAGFFLARLHAAEKRTREKHPDMEYLGRMVFCGLDEALQQTGIPLIDPDLLGRLEPEVATAFIKLRQAAEAGNAAAQYYFGRCVAEGKWGLVNTGTDAFTWYHRSAHQGYAKAMAALGFHYAAKHSPGTNAEAFYWFTLAIRFGDESVTHMRECLYNQLQADQKAESLARADAFVFKLRKN